MRPVRDGSALGLAAALALSPLGSSCAQAPPPRSAPVTDRERDLTITLVVPDGLSLRAPLVVGISSILPFEGRGVTSRVVVPSPRVTQAKGDASLTLAPLRVPRPAWISVHADLDENGSISDRDALVALAGPLDEESTKLVLDPFRLDLACVRDEDETQVMRAAATVLDPATGRAVRDASVWIETPGGGFTLPLGPAPRPPCPAGTYRAHVRDTRLGKFAGERAVDLAYPSGGVAVKVVQTPKHCREASARVKTAPRLDGPAGFAFASVDCTLLDWKPLAGENVALLGVRSPRVSLLDVGTTTPLAGVRRPAVAGSLLFDRPGAYELELYIGRATLGSAGSALGLVRHVERVE